MKTIKSTPSIYFFVFLFLALTACNNRKPSGSEVLNEADRFYSALSAEKGMNAAFLAMFDSAGVILRANQRPIEGYKAIKDLLMSESDSTFTLTWEPLFAKIAASGDLGYTYGTYQITDKVSDSVTGMGKYATIWIKKSDGKWKAILDTGSPGLGK